MKLNKPIEMQLNAAFVAKAKNTDEDAPLIIRGYANTTSRDRAGDVIPKDAWLGPNALPNYEKNPIILAYHNHSKPIGKMVEYEVTDEGLLIEAEISKAAGDVYQLIKDGVLKTFSVGFRCLDAEWKKEEDIYLIKELELFEVSVVSVPCNQDSVFEVSKSLDAPTYEAFKTQVKQKSIDNSYKEKTDMSTSNAELQALMEKLNSNPKAVKGLEIAAEKAAQEAEEAKMLEVVNKATGEQKEKLETALQLIKALSGKLEENDVAGFAKQLNTLQDEVKAKSEEISQLMAAKNTFANPAEMESVAKQLGLEGRTDIAKMADDAVLVKLITKQPLDQTKTGAELIKAVNAANASSSIQVSSENFETVFSNRLLRDIQKELVVGNLFQRLPMSSKKLTMQINPDSQDATWVDASSYGKEASTGNELSVALGEVTFTTFKLAAKAYITDETEEDAIVALLPLIRRHLVESHATAIEKAFMGGEDTAPAGKPTGLLTFAKLDSKRIATAATADGTKKVTASMIQGIRRQLGLKGLRLDKLALIVSMDAYYDLLEDKEFQDVSQVGENVSVKLQGQLGRIYGMPVMVSNFFPAKAAKKEFACIVYRPDFVVPQQRDVTVEYERRASEQRDAYYVTQRLNLQRYFTGNVVSATYA